MDTYVCTVCFNEYIPPCVSSVYVHTLLVILCKPLPTSGNMIHIVLHVRTYTYICICVRSYSTHCTEYTTTIHKNNNNNNNTHTHTHWTLPLLMLLSLDRSPLVTASLLILFSALAASSNALDTDDVRRLRISGSKKV